MRSLPSRSIPTRRGPCVAPLSTCCAISPRTFEPASPACSNRTRTWRDDAVMESPRQAVKSAWSAALEGRLPERPSELREAVQSRAAKATLTSLQKLVDALRARESADVAQAADWRALRGSVHQALAVRGSRVALYDLKESLSEARTPLPVSFLSAVHTVGDSSCLEPLAQAYAHAAAPEEWWRQQLASAFRAVMTREKLTRRSAAVKRVLAKWPGMSGGMGS